MEDYATAAQSRLTDWEVLCDKKRRTGSIHMGGIYVEFMIKVIICCYYTVETRGTEWLVNGNIKNRPGHLLTAPYYRSLLPDLYDNMPDEVADALEYVSKPEDVSYIDYRYVPEKNVSDRIFNKWMEKFICIFDYLEQIKHEV